MRATRFLDVELPAWDIPGQMQFYRDVLALPVAGGPSGVVVTAGETILRFVATTRFPPPASHFAFNVPADGLDRVIATLEPDVRWLPDPVGRVRHAFPSWQAEAVYALDPAGHVLEFIARRAAGPGLGRGTGPLGILGVSELGVVVDDVAERARELSAGSGLEPYGRAGDSFAALGDPRGLLIVVERGRAWFPENETAAQPVSTRATIEGERHGHWLDRDECYDLTFVPPSAPPAR